MLEDSLIIKGKSMNTNDESTNSNDKSHSHLKDSDTHSWTESTDFDAVDTSTYSEVLTSFRTYSLCSIESFSDEPMEANPDNAGSMGTEEASGQKSQDLITHQPEAGQNTEPTLSPDEEETHNAFCPEEPMAGSSDNANSIKTEEVSTQKIRVLIANNTATQPAKSVPKSRQIVHEANQSLDFINPLITGVALVSSALLMAHPDSGLIHIVVDDSLAVASAIRPIPAIVNTGLDSVQSVYHDYDSHAGQSRQTQLGITMLANLLRVPSAILSDVGTKALPAANPTAVGLGTAATVLGFAANALGCIASVIGIYYFSYKIYQVNKHAEALRRWADELLIFERVLKRLENAQALGEIKNEELASIKTGLIRALAGIEAQDEYKKAWVDLIKQSENIKQLTQNIHNGLSIVSGFVGNNTLAIENDDKLIKLQQAARQEPKLQVLNKVVKQDPKLENMRTGFTKLQNAPASNINQFKREIAFTRRQAELDIDKKHFEYDRCKFWLGVTVVGLAVSVTFLTLSCLALANPAFAIPRSKRPTCVLR